MPDADHRFRFVQFEFPWALGPDDGRYLVRAPGAREPTHVLVLATLGARERRRRSRRRGRRVDPEPEPTPVTTARATAIESRPLEEADAAAWLSGLRGEARLATLAEALVVLNRALHLHRVSSADAGVADASLERALVTRVGYGTGDQVAEGRWSAAVEVPAATRRRARRGASALRPEERLAALLAGRDRVLACEELVLRARVDLDAGRLREAALQVRVALEAAIAELPADADRAGDLAGRLGELRDQREPIGAAANAALTGELDAQQVAAVAHAVGRVEAALRARSAPGFSGD